jgi:hypothetical protein
VFHSTIDPWNQTGWDESTFITHILPFFIIYSKSYTRILDWRSPWYAYMTVKVLDGVWYNTSRNPIRTLFSTKVSTTRDITHKLCIHDLPTPSSQRAVIQAAIVIAFYWDLCPCSTALLRIHATVQGCDWSNHGTSQSVLHDYCPGIQLAKILMYSFHLDNLPSISCRSVTRV